jgi:hypothetical protein
MEDHPTSITTSALPYPGREPLNLVRRPSEFRGKLANPELEELAKTMTFQVALLGTDGGWVLASDTLMRVGSGLWVAGRETTFMDRTRRSKIVDCPKWKFIYAFSGVAQLSAKAGEMLEARAENSNGIPPESRWQFLNEIDAEVSIPVDENELVDRKDRADGSTLIVIFYGSPTELLTLRIGSGVTNYSMPPTADEPLFPAYGGATNLAMYLPNGFYEPKAPRQLKPVSHLKFLAACAVLEANFFEPKTVGGLELSYQENDKAEVKKALLPELEAIRQRYKRFKESLRRMLLSPSPKLN